MATDEVASSRARCSACSHCYVHDGVGGNNVKSRAERNEIYYNWIEGAYYHELELIGPEWARRWQPRAWRARTRTWSATCSSTPRDSATWCASAATARARRYGRYRFVNNTIFAGNARHAAVFRLFDGIESLEMHNNVIWREGGSSVSLVRAVEADWLAGSAKVTGTNNWIDGGFVLNPSNLPNTISGTITGSTPGFANLAGYDLSPGAGSPLLNAGNPLPVSPAGYETATPLFPPVRHPPPRALIPVGSAPPRVPNGAIDIGAFEQIDNRHSAQRRFEG